MIKKKVKKMKGLLNGISERIWKKGNERERKDFDVGRGSSSPKGV